MDDMLEVCQQCGGEGEASQGGGDGMREWEPIPDGRDSPCKGMKQELKDVCSSHLLWAELCPQIHMLES